MESRNHYARPTGAVRCTTVTGARRDLNRLIAGINEDGVPIHITSPKGNAVLVSEDDWNGIQETLYLQSIPGMRERLLAAACAPDEEFVDAKDVKW